ncbi:hypothetical protein GW17_00058047, partial [Ensete ventricosum]
KSSDRGGKRSSVNGRLMIAVEITRGAAAGKEEGATVGRTDDSGAAKDQGLGSCCKRNEQQKRRLQGKQLLLRLEPSTAAVAAEARLRQREEETEEADVAAPAPVAVARGEGVERCQGDRHRSGIRSCPTWRQWVPARKRCPRRLSRRGGRGRMLELSAEEIATATRARRRGGRGGTKGKQRSLRLQRAGHRRSTAETILLARLMTKRRQTIVRLAEEEDRDCYEIARKSRRTEKEYQFGKEEGMNRKLRVRRKPPKRRRRGFAQAVVDYPASDWYIYAAVIDLRDSV